MPAPIHLAHLDAPAARALVATGRPLILPLGSFEQHGPHLPLHTDSVCVDALAQRAAARTDAAVLPTLPYGAASLPRSGGGPTLGLGGELPLARYADLLQALLASLLERGAERLLVLTWHYENAAALWDAARTAQAGHPSARVVLVDSPLDLFDGAELTAITGRPVDARFEHAGLLETAMMLALLPEQVGDPAAVRAAEPRRRYDVLPPRAGDVPPSGAFTDPAAATAAMGEALIETIAARLARIIEEELQ